MATVDPLAFVSDAFGNVLDQVADQVTVGEETLPPKEAARLDGLLPVFMLEAASIWENLAGEPVDAPMAPDRNANLGLRVVGSPTPAGSKALPTAVTLACLTEAAHIVLDENRSINLSPLLNRWQAKLDSLRLRPAPSAAPRADD